MFPKNVEVCVFVDDIGIAQNLLDDKLSLFGHVVL